MFLKFLAKYRDAGLLFLRFGLGVAFIVHGLPKLSGGPAAWRGIGQAMGNLGIHCWPEFWGLMAAISEGLGGVFLILGAFFRPACLLLAFTMAVAVTQLASNARTRDFKVYSHPLEMAVVFIGLAFVGPGRFSIDRD